ncbi:MAG: M48 family metallopeptidase [Deltaproteobacteria bacterium]
MAKLTFVSFIFVAIYLLQLIFFIWMERLNRTHVQRLADHVPDPLRGLVDEEKLARINAYQSENSNLGIFRKVTMDGLLLALILTGSLTYLDSLSVRLHLPYLLAGALFFILLGLIFFAVEIPFDYYHTFVIEEKFGFNRSTVNTWVTDKLKGWLLGVALLVAILVPVLWTIRMFPDYWWFWAFLVVSVGQFCITILYPILIAPLFNKFEPLKDRLLAAKVERLIERVNMKSKGIYQMDAGRRSTHSNAYFTGVGKTKRIVLFDTLIESHDHDEILAVLAHELGHFTLKHVRTSLIFFVIATLVGFYLTQLVMRWDLLYSTFHLDPSKPYLALLIIGVFWKRAGYFLSPFYMVLSRRFERQADAFGAKLLHTPQPMVKALKVLATHNLANLNPHPFYVWFNYSHPPLVERVRILEAMDTSPAT